MKKTAHILIVLVILAGLSFFVTQIDDDKTIETINNQEVTFSDTELGLEFDYRVGPLGYVLEETTPANAQNNLVRILTLIKSEDKLGEVPLGGEWPPVISVSIFENSKKQLPQAWADENIQYSNINLKFGEVFESLVGGAKAIRYMSDGLYASENAVIMNGDNIYLVNGQFIDEDSSIRRDFLLLLESINFISN